MPKLQCFCCELARDHACTATMGFWFAKASLKRNIPPNVRVKFCFFLCQRFALIEAIWELRVGGVQALRAKQVMARQTKHFKQMEITRSA